MGKPKTLNPATPNDREALSVLYDVATMLDTDTLVAYLGRIANDCLDEPDMIELSHRIGRAAHEKGRRSA